MCSQNSLPFSSDSGTLCCDAVEEVAGGRGQAGRMDSRDKPVPLGATSHQACSQKHPCILLCVYIYIYCSVCVYIYTYIYIFRKRPPTSGGGQTNPQLLLPRQAFLTRGWKATFLPTLSWPCMVHPWLLQVSYTSLPSHLAPTGGKGSAVLVFFRPSCTLP